MSNGNQVNRDQMVAVISVLTGKDPKEVRRSAAARIEAKYKKLSEEQPDRVAEALKAEAIGGITSADVKADDAPKAAPTATEGAPKAETAPTPAPEPTAAPAASQTAPASPIVSVVKDGEKTTTTINAGGGILVDVVEKHGADVVKAAADAVGVSLKQENNKVAGAPVNKWPEGKLPFKLEKSDRAPELLTKAQAAARNLNRSDGRRWLACPDADPATVVTPNDTPVGKEREEKLREGARKDRLADEQRAARIAAKQKEVEEHEDDEEREEGSEGRVRLKGNKPAKKAAKAEKTARANWEGLGMCALIRYMAANEYEKDEIMVATKKAGFEANPATIQIQSKKGQKGEGVPEVSKELAKKIKDLTK